MPKLELLTLPGCAHCGQFKHWWHDVAKDFPKVEYHEIDGLSDEGQALIQQHMIMAAPAIFVNGKLVSTGGFNGDEIKKRLASAG